MAGRWLLCALLAATIAGCGDGDDRAADKARAPPRAAPPERAGPAQPLERGEVLTERMTVPELEGLPVAAGQWTYAEDSRGRVTRFARQLSIRCLPATLEIEIVRGGATGRSLTVLTDRGVNLFDAYPMKAQGGDATMARFPASYAWFEDALAPAEGIIGVRIDDGVPLAVPADPTIARVIGGCRPGGGFGR